MTQVRPAVAIAGVAAVIGIVAIARKANAAKLASARERASSSPGSSPGEPPLLPARTSSAQEGAPLAWDQREHPLADRGLDDGGLEVIEMPPIDVPGESVPAGPASMPAPPPPPAPAPSSTTPRAKTKTKRRAAPAAPAAPTSSPAAPPAPGSSRDPAQAARELYAHADKLTKSGRSGELGNAARPSSFVRDAQTDMGGVRPDGIYGPDTRARGRALIGKTFPVRK